MDFVMIVIFCETEYERIALVN